MHGVVVVAKRVDPDVGERMNIEKVTGNIVKREGMEDIGSFRGELLERLQEKREGL